MNKLIIILFILISATVAGQDMNSSKIKLTDGSVLQAAIVESQQGDFIRIRIAENHYSTINFNEIESIRGFYYNYKRPFSLDKGFFAEASYAFMFGQAGEMGDIRAGMSLGLTGNYRFNPSLSLGAGVEVNALYVNSDFFLVPLYGRISGSFSERKVVPYYMLDLGWSSASTGDTRQENIEMHGGLFFRPEIGIRINKVRVGIGYQNQQVRTSYTTNFGWGSEQKVVEDRVLRNFRMGVSVIF